MHIAYEDMHELCKACVMWSMDKKQKPEICVYKISGEVDKKLWERRKRKKQRQKSKKQ